MIEWIKTNPIKFAGLVILFIVLYMYMSGGSSSSTTTSSSPGYDPATVQAGMQLQAAQMQQQGQLAALQTQANAQSDQTAAAVAIATLQAQTAQQQNVLGAQVAGHSLDVQYEIANSANTLQGAIAASNNATQAQIAAMTQATNQLVVQAGIRQTEVNADVMKTQISANADVLNRQTAVEQTKAKGANQQGLVKGVINPLGCYITTIVVHTLGYADDCDALTVLRDYRDGVMPHISGGPEALAEYRIVGPRIVQHLEALSPQYRQAVAAHYWMAYIRPAVVLVKAGHNTAAFHVYKAMVEELSAVACTPVGV